MHMKLSPYKHLKSIVNIILTPSGYRSDYWTSLVNADNLSNNPLPWMNYKAIDHITKYINKTTTVFEYGSGSSTQYWISRGCSVISIEHDKLFYTQLSKKIKHKCDYYLNEPIALKSTKIYNPASPDLFQSNDFNDYSFENYVKFIDQFEDNFFDMVVVDGRARPSCVKRALSKLKKGGLLVLDNSDRDYYLSETADLLKNWSRNIFKGTVRGLLHQEQTTVFVKP